MAIDAAASRNGTIFSNDSDGVASSRMAPTVPPASAAQARGRTRRDWPASSGRDPATEPMVAKIKATLLVTLAVTGASPTASSAG